MLIEVLHKTLQDIQRHYTGKHNILKMWVDEFLRQQAGWLEVTLTLDDLKTKRSRLRGPELTFKQMEQIAIQQQQGEEEDIIDVKEDQPEEEMPLSSVNTEVDLSSSCLTISKIPRASRSPDKLPETPPSISLIRINKAKSSLSTTATLLLQTVAARAAALEPQRDLKESDCLEMINPKSSLAKSTLSFKHPCPQCDMSFPTQSARSLHQEVCQHPQRVTFLSPPSPISEEPVRKKKRLPPPLIPL